MSLAIVRNVLSKVPVPLAGNAVTAVGFAAQKSKAIPRYAPWALPCKLNYSVRNSCLCSSFHEIVQSEVD